MIYRTKLGEFTMTAGELRTQSAALPNFAGFCEPFQATLVIKPWPLPDKWHLPC